jgi:DNA-binding GntR family transcriptional regulator
VLAVIDPAGLSVLSAPYGLEQVKGTADYESISYGDDTSAGTGEANRGAGPKLGVLAARIATTVARHDPGWRLPRMSVLARRFGVKPREVAAAVSQLADLHLVRRMPDSRYIRVSPAEYHIPFPATAGLLARVTPIGGALECRAMSIGRPDLRDDVAKALGASAGDEGCSLRLQFTVADEPAAVSTTYAIASRRPLIEKLAASERPGLLPFADLQFPADGSVLTAAVGATSPDLGASHRAVQLEFQQPSPGIASLLRLRAGDKAIAITATGGGDDPTLTTAILRADSFRVTIESAQLPLPEQVVDGYSSGWAHVGGPWQV